MTKKDTQDFLYNLRNWFCLKPHSATMLGGKGYDCAGSHEDKAPNVQLNDRVNFLIDSEIESEND